MKKNQGWEFPNRFSERIAHFLQKNEQMAQKNEQFAHSLIFGERPERITHGRSFLVIRSHCSFLVSDLSDLLTSFLKKEGMINSLIFLF